MDEDDNPTNDHHRSNTYVARSTELQAFSFCNFSVDMTNASPEQENPTANDDSEQQSVQEETGKPDDEKSTTNNEAKPSPVVQERTDKSDDEEAKTNTIHKKQQRSIVKNYSGDEE